MNMTDVDIDRLSPMMKEYVAMKKDYMDCILLYRLGDFYEMFFEDAVKGSKELELALTGRSCGLDERAPMCGVPFHAVDTYLDRLVKKGHKVAVCEQLEDPKEAKGIVKRGVIRVVTPGSTLSSASLDETKNNYLVCIVESKGIFGIAKCDITTGDFYVEESYSHKECIERLLKIAPSEILYSLETIDVEKFIPRGEVISTTAIEGGVFSYERSKEILKEQFRVGSISALDLDSYTAGVLCSAHLISYLRDLQKGSLDSIMSLKVYHSDEFMVLDNSTRRNLELTQTMHDSARAGSLISALDRTKTAMGARKLREMIEEPLLSRDEIIKRQDVIEELKNDISVIDELRDYLTPVYDLERLLGRITYGTANPRDLIAFMTSLSSLPGIKFILKEMKSDLALRLDGELDLLEDIHELISSSIVEEPPISVREGGFIKDGFNEHVDRFRYASNNGKSLLASVEEEEKKKTGISTLRIKYNKVFGYFIEVSKGQIDKVPDYYVRKQTLTNYERYIVPKLKELEDTILGAQEKLVNLEYELFCDIRKTIASKAARIRKTAEAVAYIDALCSLSYVAVRNKYVRPSINEQGRLSIKQGRHPVVEHINRDEVFIPNDTELDQEDNRLNIITGPNMAGKSTYMRQVALIQLMAQMGSFVPAEQADIGIVDRIFTRVGASDDLASGQSTFMVEMNEVSNILRNATRNSLIILDEIGRGTSTYDGLSIAWAVTEAISDTDRIGAKTLFATHYHELTSLEGRLGGVHNMSMAVKEKGDDVIFLRRVIPGGADKSYGIQVAKLAGVPNYVITRAKDILSQLVKERGEEELDITLNSIPVDSPFAETKSDYNQIQLSLFSNRDNEILEELKSLDINNLTPIEVVGRIVKMQARLKETDEK